MLLNFNESKNKFNTRQSEEKFASLSSKFNFLDLEKMRIGLSGQTSYSKVLRNNSMLCLSQDYKDI